MSICSTNTAGLRKAPRAPQADMEPLAVPPKTAWRLLGISNTTGYQLIRDHEIESFLVGRSRRVPLASIRNLIDRRLADNKAWRNLEKPARKTSSVAS
jgi:excisionase family DNA binding protein